MTGLQLLGLTGLLVGGGLALLLMALIPAAPSLSGALSQLSAEQTATPATARQRDRWGWLPTGVASVLERHLGVSDADLRILGWTRSGLAARKVTVSLAGLLAPTVFTITLAVVGVTIPVSIPVVFALVLAGWLWTIPTKDAREDAAKARREFRAALSAFLDLVALERLARGSVPQALEAAAGVSDAPPFVAIRETLHRAALSGQTPWSALKELGEELDIEELRNLGDIAASASDGAAIYKTLLAESRTLRHAELAAALAEANARSERMSMLNSLLVVGLAFFIMTALVFRMFQTI